MKSLGAVAAVVLLVGLSGCNDSTQLQVAKLGAGEGLVTGVLIHNGETPVTSTDLRVNCGTTCATDTRLKQKFRLTAKATLGSKFTGWTGRDLDGKCTDGAADCEVLISWSHRPDTDNSPIVVETHFEPVFSSGLTVNKIGGGTGKVVSEPSGIDCGATCLSPYADGTMVKLTATTDTGSLFAGWSGGGCSGTATTCTATVSGTTVVTASFLKQPGTVLVSKTGTGAGRITSAPGGIDCGSTCTAQFEQGSIITLTATPQTGSVFSSWAGACTGITPCLLTVTEVNAAVATFSLATFPLTVHVNGTGSGRVSSSPAGIDCTTGDCSASFAAGASVTLTAVAATGSRFTGWMGAGCSGTGTCVVTLDAAKDVSATFITTPVTLTVTRTGGGSGTITSTPAGITCGPTCASDFAPGTSVSLTAAPDSDSVFTGWSGACTGMTTCVVPLMTAATVTANFERRQVSVTVTKMGTGAGVVSSSPAGIDCGLTCSANVPSGSSITLSATPDADSIFTGWSGGGCTGTGPCVLTPMAAISVTATFAPVEYAFSVIRGGSGGGTITSAPTGIACGATCSMRVPRGTTVTLTAVADNLSTFAGWNVASCQGTGPCAVTVMGDTTVTAAFTLTTAPLTITKNGTGSGTVTSAPTGLSCGATCTAPFVLGTSVILTAAEASGSTFTGWGGACSGTALTCTVTVSMATTVSANFTLNPNTLAVTKTGTGTGTVTSAPAGINCGTMCSAVYTPGTPVTLTATAAGDSTFTGWSGGGCAGTGTCVVTLSASALVTATFSLRSFALDVTKGGTGNGTVTSAPAGINCGATCSASFLSGTGVTLVPSAAGDSFFSGWTGACTGTGACTVTVDAAKTVGANFTLNSYSVTVSKAGTGSGTVTSAPTGITCGATCSASFNHGSVITLTAVAASDSTFSGWSGGGCTGTGTCVVTLTAAATVTANFTLRTYALSLSKGGTGGGAVTSTPAGINCGATCSASFTHGATVTLTAFEASDSTFSGWSGGGCSGTGTCVVTLTGATTVTANFTLKTYALTVSKTGTGSGAVTSTPSGISCGATCMASFTHGSLVTLTAAQAADSTFSGWTGGGCSGTGSCVVTLTAATTVTASFTLRSYALTVSKSGAGSGTVTSAPTGISCGATCSSSFNHGTMVTLTAAEAVDSTFTGWSGGGCSGTGSCVVTLTAATTVGANFALKSHTLTVSKAGTGSGTVNSAPAGISCGATCSSSVNHGTTVTLTAAEAIDSTFTGWSGGGCSGAGACVVTVTAATTVTASFALKSYALSVSKSGGGSGTVTSVPAGLSCGITCSSSFNHGTVVTLTATAAPGSTFTGWTGSGCSGTGTCAVTMMAAASVTATFVLPNFAFVTSSVTTGAMGGLSGADILCQQRAAVAGLAGTYRAWLSTSTTNAIDRLGSASGWVRTDGLPFVNSKADLVAGRILYPLRLDEFGNDVFTTTVFATTLGNGVLDGTLSHCTDWTSTVSQFPAGAGNPSATTTTWTSGAFATCGSPQRLYCFAVDVQATARPQLPAQFRRAFVSTSPWTPGGGIATADTVCANEAAAANLPGTYKALLTPLNDTAASRFVTAGPPWVRVDDVAISVDAAALFNRPFWQAALDVTAAGVHVVDTTWSGSANVAMQGSISDTCAGWTSASTNFTAGTGTTNQTELRNAFGEVTSDVCNQPHRLLCLQE